MTGGETNRTNSRAPNRQELAKLGGLIIQTLSTNGSLGEAALPSKNARTLFRIRALAKVRLATT